MSLSTGMCALFAAGSAAVESYVPPKQTPRQIKAMDRIRATAKELSALATPHVERMLSSPDFKSTLAQYSPALAALPARELLARYRAQVDVTEITHAFQAANDPTQLNALDMDIDMMLAPEATWFYNQWQLPVLFPERETAAFYQLVSFLAPAAVCETGG